MTDQTQGPVPAAAVDAHEERWSTLEQLDDWLRTPMLVLSLVWLVLVVIELVRGGSRMLDGLGIAIWAVFVAEFALRFTLAPAKLAFLRSNGVTVLSLLAPALRMIRVLRVFRAARALRGLRLVRIVGTANRGMNALRAGLRRRGFGYVVGLTVMVALLGAGGMLAFEPASEVVDGDAAGHHGVAVLARDEGGTHSVLPARVIRVRSVRLHHRELCQLLRRPRRGIGRRRSGQHRRHSGAAPGDHCDAV